MQGIGDEVSVLLDMSLGGLEIPAEMFEGETDERLIEVEVVVWVQQTRIDFLHRDDLSSC